MSAATFLGFLGKYWWFFDLFAHFRIQLFLGLLLVTLATVFRRSYRISTCLGVFAALNLGTIIPLYLGQTPLPFAGSKTFRSLLINVNTEAGDPARVAQTVHQLAPDILVLEEVNEEWLATLASALSEYPYSTKMPREDNFGIALFSRHQLARSEVRQIGEAGLPSIVAEVETPNAKFTIIATHPLPPGGAEHSRLRNEQFERLAEVVRQAASPVLLIGDLNATPWSYHFKRLLRDSGLQDSSKGLGVLATWPTHLPILLIPLDHVLHSERIQVIKKAVGPNVGSDHYPVVADFSMQQ